MGDGADRLLVVDMCNVADEVQSALAHPQECSPWLFLLAQLNERLAGLVSVLEYQECTNPPNRFINTSHGFCLDIMSGNRFVV